jgi:GNAT superfamily N-acetyltransferase
VIQAAGPDLAGVRSLYREVGFRDDLVEDLHFLRRIGGDVFVATRDDAVVGASSCLPFGRTAWIGGVAVAPDARRQGLGERLTAVALDALLAGGAATVLLHATPMARSLYERLGFERDDQVIEFTGPGLHDPGRPCPDVRPGRSADLDAVLALDEMATGEDRRRMLVPLWDGSSRVVHDGALRGFHIPQLASAAGEVVASGPEAGRALLGAALARPSRALRVAVPERASESLRLLTSKGYQATSRTTRMHRGPSVRRLEGLTYSAFNMFWG